LLWGVFFYKFLQVLFSEISYVQSSAAGHVDGFEQDGDAKTDATDEEKE
jgi:hypothetical protein